MVIGTYKCGCSYGPVIKKDRLEYCPIHGQEIQREYVVPKKVKKKKESRNG